MPERWFLLPFFIPSSKEGELLFTIQNSLD